MKVAGQFILCFATVALILVNARADDLAVADNPYTGIVERNVFALIAIPTNPPVVEPPPDPPLKITPNGIMKLFGRVEALFKVTTKAPPGQPPKDESHMMGEGDREDDIEVVKIDEQARTITFNNHGVIQTLPLVESKQTVPAGGGAGPGMISGAGGGIPAPMMSSGTMPRLIGRGGLAGRRGMDADTASSPPPPTATGFRAATPSTSNGQPGASQPITAEDQIISMEQQRAKLLDEGSPAAAILPPTKLGEQLIGGGEMPNDGPPKPP